MKEIRKMKAVSTSHTNRKDVINIIKGEIKK